MVKKSHASREWGAVIKKSHASAGKHTAKRLKEHCEYLTCRPEERQALCAGTMSSHGAARPAGLQGRLRHVQWEASGWEINLASLP